MKKIITGLILLFACILFVFHNLTKNDFKPVFKSEYVEDNLNYTEECLLGEYFQQGNDFIHVFIRENEIYFELVDIFNKKTSLLKKIPKNELGYLKISTPYLISKPRFYKTNNDKILVIFNGLNSQKKVVPHAVLYDIKTNSHKNIPFLKLKDEIRAANSNNVVVSGLNGKNFVIETFDDTKEKFLTLLDTAKKNYSSLEVLANGKYLILDVWQKPLMIFNPKNHKTVKFENPPVYFMEVKGGNLVFVEEKNSAMLLSYYDTEKYNKKVLLSAKKIDIRPVIGYLKNNNYVVARINGEDFSVNVINGEKYKIETSEDNNFMIDIGNNKYVVNKTNAAYILDLTTGKASPRGKLTGWPSNFSYPLDEDNTIIINDMTDKTFIANNKTNEIKKSADLSGKFYHTYPHKVIALKDGTIIIRYTENCSETEKNLKETGKIIDIFAISLCSEKNYAFCSEFNSIPYYSYTVTDVWKKRAK